MGQICAGHDHITSGVSSQVVPDQQLPAPLLNPDDFDFGVNMIGAIEHKTLIGKHPKRGMDILGNNFRYDLHALWTQLTQLQERWKQNVKKVSELVMQVVAGIRTRGYTCGEVVGPGSSGEHLFP
jgi:hypothetical protein